MAITAKSIDHQCKQHLIAQGITSKETLQRHLQIIFEQAEYQEAVLIGLYKMLIPDWEHLERLEGFPVVGQALDEYIFNLFIQFDQIHHPQVFNGGLWINQGFSSSDDIGPWEISIDRCNVIYS